MKTLALLGWLVIGATAQSFGQASVFDGSGRPSFTTTPFISPTLLNIFEFQIAERSVVYEGKEYKLTYRYGGSAMVPATMPEGQPHYSARIIVLFPDKSEVTIQDGTYVPNGCFEDVPVEWVKKAIAIRGTNKIVSDLGLHGYIQFAGTHTTTNTSFTNLFIPSWMEITNVVSVTKWTPEFIKDLASKGTICEVMDHIWIDGRKPMTQEDFKQATQAVWRSLNPDDTKPHRYCRFCGRVEIKTEEWKAK